MMEYRKPKFLIIGHGRHGKDTVAELFEKRMGLKFSSSSKFVAEKIIWNQWGKNHYNSFDKMYEDRANHRTLWGNLISEYNTPNKARTAQEMLKAGNHMYVGMRRPDELKACRELDLFNLIIWVDASERLPLESRKSMMLTEEDADFIINNNKSEEYLIPQIQSLINIYAKFGYNITPDSELFNYGK